MRSAITFSIITPSFRQLDWLRLCVTSVKDQVLTNGGTENVESRPSNQGQEAALAGHQTTTPPLSVEHIIQDAGTPGIEDFAREVGADFYRDGKLVFTSAEGGAGIRETSASTPSTHDSRPSACASESPFYRMAIYSERDAGMYDAVNRGIRRSGGEFVAYLNCDEQYLPGTLRRVAEFFDNNPAVEVLFMDAIVVDSDGNYLCDRCVMVPKRLHTLVSGNLSIITAATFSRRSVFSSRNLYFNAKWKDVGDADWVLQLIQSGLRMRALNQPASIFTDTGENMNCLPNAIREKALFFQSAPTWARCLRNLIVFEYRVRRLLKGLYFLKPHSYEIFTRSSPTKRVTFHVTKPTFLWRR